MWRMIFDIVRFNQFALDLLAYSDESEGDPTDSQDAKQTSNKPRWQETIGEYLDREGYSDSFRDDYLIPMAAAVWSTSPDKCSLEFPAVTLVRFMWNHHLLSTVSARPQWMTIEGGAKRYIDSVMKDFPKQRVHLKSAVTNVRSDQDGRVMLRTSSGQNEQFDHVILATHGGQALDIIRPSATDEEVEILSGFQTSKNKAVLHSDLSVC